MGYATEVKRTEETLRAAFDAGGIDPETKILEDQNPENIKAFFALPGTSYSDEFLKEYDKRISPRREECLKQQFSGKKLKELTPDQQETVMEYAEEPAIEWYLSLDDKRFDDKTPSPREWARAVAFKMNRLINLPDYMPNDKSVDLVSAGHKTSTEAFLKYAITRKVQGEKVTGFDSLKDIGGSLKILDSWDLQVENDQEGNKQITIILRRENGDTQKFGIDLEVLRQLAQEHITAEDSIDAKKIDNL
ncbi:hypothetical protein KKF32_05125 [Patescibacteria group bacterium]|nr:hypothetical protein [Patescibacteria group bacterium]